MFSPGELLEHRYEVLGLLGEGAVAKVWRVRHLGLHSEHALKVLRPELVQAEGVSERFLAEGQIQSQLRHPNIVAVSDVITAPLPALVMDLVEGPTLGAALAKQGSFSPEAAVNLMLPVLDAVALAHAAGVIHRDLKPENILLGQGPRGALHPMVTDFGFARVLAETNLRTDRLPTQMPVATGSAGYRSPEQVRGEPVDARSDQFALGALLVELITGRTLFSEGFEAERALAEGRFRPAEAVADLEPALATCVARALAGDPAQRFPSCLAFAEALRAARPAPPSPAVAIPIPQPPPRPPPPLPSPPPPPPPVSLAPPTRERPARSSGVSPWVAGALNLFCPLGLGQLANGQVGKGMLVFIAHAWLAIASHGLSWPVTWILATVDAYLVAERRRQGHPAGRWGWF